MNWNSTYNGGVADGKIKMAAYIVSLLPDDFSESKDWQQSDSAGRIEWLKSFNKSLLEERDLCYAQLTQQKNEIDRLNKIIHNDFNKKYLENVGG